jgi:hypothetical protein
MQLRHAELPVRSQSRWRCDRERRTRLKLHRSPPAGRCALDPAAKTPPGCVPLPSQPAEVTQMLQSCRLVQQRQRVQAVQRADGSFLPSWVLQRALAAGAVASAAAAGFLHNHAARLRWTPAAAAFGVLGGASCATPGCSVQDGRGTQLFLHARSLESVALCAALQPSIMQRCMLARRHVWPVVLHLLVILAQDSARLTQDLGNGLHDSRIYTRQGCHWWRRRTCDLQAGHCCRCLRSCPQSEKIVCGHDISIYTRLRQHGPVFMDKHDISNTSEGRRNVGRCLTGHACIPGVRYAGFGTGLFSCVTTALR